MFDIINYQPDVLGPMVFIVAFLLDFVVFFGADVHRVFARKWNAPKENQGAVVTGFLWRLGFFCLAYPFAIFPAVVIVGLLGAFIHYGFYE